MDYPEVVLCHLVADMDDFRHRILLNLAAQLDALAGIGNPSHLGLYT